MVPASSLLPDWSYYLYGPLLYDLASAVMYVGGQDHAGELIQAYLCEDVLDHAESATLWRRCCDSGGPCRRITLPGESPRTT